MEISTGNPGLLRQQDIQAPFIAIIADVRIETLKDKRGNEDKEYVVYFAVGKPMKFNVINRKTVVAAYGKEREGWIGKPIEIYVDPNVFMGAERTGGIRVRIPTGPGPVGPASARSGSPAPASGSRPGAAPRTTPTPTPQLTLAQKHAQALAGFAGAPTLGKLEEWAMWAKKLGFGSRQNEALADAYHDRKERLAAAARQSAKR